MPRQAQIRALLPGISLGLFLVVALSTILWFQHFRINENGTRGVIRHDVISYYSYLPAAVVHGDVSLSFLGEEEFKNENRFWYVKLDNGNRLVITSMGLSFLYAPFFFIAHLLAPVLGQSQDGFSNIYQLMLLISGLFYAFMGLLLLSRFMKRYFDPIVRAIVLLAVGLGTNLFYYSTIQAAMPHSHNFFLVMCFMALVVRWYEKPNWKRALGVGLLFGLIVLVRPSNILLFLFLFLYGVRSWKTLLERIVYYLQRWYLVLIMLAGFFLPWIPQFLYWKAITGHYLFFTYAEKGATFYFAHPHILESLFSFRKGWLIFTPIMIFSLLGIGLMRKRAPDWFIALVIYVAAMIYVQSSWWCWWFGGGFGLRPYISMYPLLAVALAYVFQYLRSLKSWIPFAMITSMVLILTAYQLFQTRQFTTKAIHYSGATVQTYIENFLKVRTTGASWEMLELPDFNLARLGIYTAYSTGDDPETWRALGQEEAYRRIRAEIEDNPRMKRQIKRYAEREDIPHEEAMNMVLERMFFRKSR